MKTLISRIYSPLQYSLYSLSYFSNFLLQRLLLIYFLLRILWGQKFNCSSNYACSLLTFVFCCAFTMSVAENSTMGNISTFEFNTVNDTWYSRFLVNIAHIKATCFLPPYYTEKYIRAVICGQGIRRTTINIHQYFIIYTCFIIHLRFLVGFELLDL